MHAIKGGWVGQVFALATINDSGRKKSRIRRSKEDRKDMVESYIKKYQKSNNGNFPSLNLTHKEVGGSFYTVREIVREIIQENRVLAPPKVFLDEHDHSGFIVEHPLGSLSIEPKTDSSVLGNDVNGSEVCEKNEVFDPVVIDAVPVHHQACSEESTLPSSHKFGGLGSQRLSGEEYANSNNERVKEEKVEEFIQRTFTESVVKLFPDRQNDTGEVETSHIKSNVVVEIFPLRPILPTIHDMDEDSGEVHETTETLEDKKNRHLKLESNHEYGEEKVELNLQMPSLKSTNSSTVGTGVLDLGDVKGVESNDTLPDGPKAVDSIESFITKDSTSIKRKLSDSKNTSLQTASDPILDRTDIETQEEASEKSIQLESNNVLAFIKTCFSALMRFWTE